MKRIFDSLSKVQPATKKPVTIQAIQWLGFNLEEVIEFTKPLPGNMTMETLPDKLFLNTPEGTMEAKMGDIIIKGISGEFYPCKPDIFEQTYDFDRASSQTLEEFLDPKGVDTCGPSEES